MIGTESVYLGQFPAVSIYLKTFHFTASEFKTFLTFNYGLKINLIRIFNLGVLSVNPVVGFPLRYRRV